MWPFGKKVVVEKRFASCVQCGVHYDPCDGRWSSFCPLHREERMQRDLREEEVLTWARRNIDQLYDQAVEENAKYRASRQAAMSNANQAQQSLQGQGNAFNPLSGPYNPYVAGFLDLY